MDSLKLKYHYNNVGTVVEIIDPKKAVLKFKLNGRDERALMMAKSLTLDGKKADEAKNLSQYLREGNVVYFNCHIYNKGGGAGKDKCTYFAIKAWKNSREYDLRMAAENNASNGSSSDFASHGFATSQPILPRNNVVTGTGWVRELFPRKGVLTFQGTLDNGSDDDEERVLFLASKVWLFEKRLAARQSLTEVLRVGDPLQFEAVPQNDKETDENKCTWFANSVWKGRRPQAEESGCVAAPLLANGSNTTSLPSSRRTSLVSEANVNPLIPSLETCDLSTFVNGQMLGERFLTGVGIVGKVFTEKCGVIWWLMNSNHFQSVLFESKHTKRLGMALEERGLLSVSEGEPVVFVAERAPANFATMWVSKSVLIVNDTSLVERILNPDTKNDIAD